MIVRFAKGRIIVRGKLVTRGQAKRADHILSYQPNIPLALNTLGSIIMRQFIPFILITLVFASGYLALRIVPTNNPRPARPVNLASSNWEPFIGPELENNGPVAMIVNETIRRMGYEPEISFASWELIQQQTSRSEILGAFPLILSNERTQRYHHSDPILEFEYVLFYNTLHIQNPEAIQTVDDLANQNYRFGKVRGYDVWPELAAAAGEFDVEYDTSAQAFQALADGEIDFLPEGRLPGLVIISGSDILVDSSVFGILEAPAASALNAREGLHFLMPRTIESQRFLEQFNAALAQVKTTPVYEEALTRIDSVLSEAIRVELQPIPGDSIISVVDSMEETTVLQVPLGTRAVVIEWAESFENGTVVDQSLYSTVKLLNGPQQGRVVLVDNRAIKLIP